MTTAMGSNRLPILAAEIRKAHADVQEAAKTAAERAIEAGHALIEAKELLKHGEWLPWLREHCELPERTAQAYMRLARSGIKSATVADLGLKAALASLSTPRSERSGAAPDEVVSLEGYLADSAPLKDGEIRLAIADVKPAPPGTRFRSEVNVDHIRRLAKYLPHLPPIEVNQRHELIDGWYRLEAYKLAGAKTIRATVTPTESELAHLILFCERNCSHGLPLLLEEDERNERRLAELAP